ncbi:MAG: 4-hydroxythreonine-4-phosphate dehydrogenase PdxA [Acidobacteriota bacterium]|nr:4-hydroxythreonine-4-phosphate dehydrogenase PdxA [Acidobacteriota bacterium]
MNVSVKKQPRVGITIGDPAGIGSEVVLKALAEISSEDTACLPVVIGDAAYLREAAALLDLPCDFRTIKKGEAIPENQTEPLIYDLENISEKVVFGSESAATGRAAADYIETAVEMCLKNELDAICTAPISKHALALAGINFPGHTEMLASLSNTKEFAMSFFAGKLRVVLLSTHVSLRRAIELIKSDAIVELIRLTNREIQRFGIEKPHLAVAGLNPHAGEAGMFGEEERAEINPAIERCRAEGINVSGAYAADTVFWRCGRGDFDAVIALYHDQATIAVKSFAFGESVNVTLGLPFVRTSVDHGTAFDIAGKNRAEHSSMNAAINLAAILSNQDKQKKKTNYANSERG